MSNNPLVSICSPIYNGEEYLEDCIKGVLNQTYDNFEYVIVDNASTDKTPIIIEKYRKKDSRIIVYRNEKTVCMEDNLNLCAKYSSDNAKWIKYAFADDYLFPDCVEKMVKVGELDEQIGLVSAYRMAGKAVNNLGLPIDQSVFEGPVILKQEIMCKKQHVAISSSNSVMYKRIVFAELNGFNNLYDHSDSELAFRILNRYKLGFVHYVATRSGRDKGGGEYKSIFHGNKILEFMDFGYRKINNYKSIHLNEREMNELRTYYAEQIMNFLITKLAYFERDDINRMIAGTPADIKDELKYIIKKDFVKYIKIYIRSLMGIRTYIKNKRSMA